MENKIFRFTGESEDAEHNRLVLKFLIATFFCFITVLLCGWLYFENSFLKESLEKTRYDHLKFQVEHCSDTMTKEEISLFKFIDNPHDK